MATEGSTSLTEDYAARIKPLIPEARRAYGSAPAGSEPRRASDTYNTLLLEYQNRGGNIAKLAEALGVADVTLRRRLRVARSGQKLGTVGLSTRGRAIRDEPRVTQAAARIAEARDTSPEAYRDAVREAYDANISLYAVAKTMGISYHSLYAAKQ